jgi:hypothetical protein
VTTGSTVDREKQGAYHLQIQVLKRFWYNQKTKVF